MDRYEWVDPETGARWAAVRDAGLPVTRMTLARKLSATEGWMPHPPPAAAAEILRLAARVEELEAEVLMPTSEVRLLAQRWQERAEEAQERIDELAADLARLDALLEAEEPPEGLEAAIEMSTAREGPDRLAASRAWRWFRESLRAEGS